MMGQDVVLTEKDMDTIQNFRKGRLLDQNIDPYAVSEVVLFCQLACYVLQLQWRDVYGMFWPTEFDFQ
jgi:hypothetical protein